MEVDGRSKSLKIEPHNYTVPMKEIDSRWVEVKFTDNYPPRSYFAATIQAGTPSIRQAISMFMEDSVQRWELWVISTAAAFMTTLLVGNAWLLSLTIQVLSATTPLTVI